MALPLSTVLARLLFHISIAEDVAFGQEKFCADSFLISFCIVHHRTYIVHLTQCDIEAKIMKAIMIHGNLVRLQLRPLMLSA